MLAGSSHRRSYFNLLSPSGNSMEKTMKALIAVIVGASFLLGACNTVEGVGKDVKAGGTKVEQEAKENKRY
jgi:predicted small secreted protein